MSKGKIINRKYHLFDAEGKILGRLAVEIATVLRGKNKTDFAPYIDGGDFAVLINSDKIEVSGGKQDKKIYHRFSGYHGGITSEKFKDKLEKDSREIIQKAIRGMLPKNKLRDKMMGRLKIYKDGKHDHKIDIKH